MKTFSKIEYLLDEIDRLNNFESIMISSGGATRTDAGSRVFIRSIDEQMELYKKLQKFPQDWVIAVKIIKQLR